MVTVHCQLSIVHFHKLFGSEEGIDHHVLGSYGGLVQIHLPVHEAAADEVVLDGVDAFLVHHELVIHHVEHVDDA